jgi:DNA processing protein
MSRYDLKKLLTLYSIQGIGPARIRNLLAAFGSPQAVLDAPINKLIHVPGIEKSTAIKIKDKVDERYVSYQLDYIKNHDIKILTYWDEDYPERLKKIYDAPVLMFYKGDISVLKSNALGFVGTRHPSTYGKMITEKICRDLTEHNFTIVSGLARGIDTIAHQTVLKNNGRTIAVLGSGLDQIYPPENRKIAEQITRNGAVISEFVIGAIPDPGNFPRRNRIISGLSVGVIVSEAGKKSGALITAYQALDQNREVFAIPGPINSRKSVGTNCLIKQGAKLVQETSDIMLELEDQLGTVDSIDHLPAPELEGIENLVYQLLTEEPVHIDYLTQRSQRTTPEILSALLTLELMGIVKQLSGKMFVRIST